MRILNFIVIGQYTINIPEIFQVLTVNVSLFLLQDSKADVLSVRLSSFILSDEGLALKTNPNSIVELSKYQCFLSVH